MSNRMCGLLALIVGLALTAGPARADEPPADGERHGFFACLAQPFKKTKCAIKEDTLSCSSWRTEARFVFGSCKDFFGDPCPERAIDGSKGKGGCGCR
jgi:hypothetical protein